MDRCSVRFTQSVIAALALLLCAGCGQDQPKYTGPDLPYKPDPPKEKEANPQVALETSGGRIELELFEDDTPNTVGNYVGLIEKGFYNNTLFHRIAKSPPVIQGGDPNGDGSGGPGYCIPDETKGNPHKHDQYALAMARRNQPNSAGSQFYIVTAPEGAHFLDSGYTVFGKVTKGFEVVDRLAQSPVVGEKPLPDVKLLAATVLSKRKHAYEAWSKTPDPTSALPRPKAGQKTSSPIDPSKLRLPTPRPAGPKAVMPIEIKPPEKKAEDKKPEEKKAEEKKTEEKK